MVEIVWFRRGDGAEFAVQPGSDAEANLIAAGALHIEGPCKSDPDVVGNPAAPVPTKAQLLERAADLHLEIPARAKNAEIATAIDAEEARLAAEAAAGTGT